MVKATNLGFPRIGANRELKWAVESFWAGKTDEATLTQTAADIRKANWRYQQGQGLDHIPSNDFSLYDQVLDTAVMVGAIPPRYGHSGGPAGLDTYFAMARGTGGANDPGGISAMEMTKWFDTNYHYIVPEFEAKQKFTLSSTKAVDEFLEAKELGIHTRPVLVGPVSFLLLGKSKDERLDNLSLLDNLLPVYEEVLRKLAEAGADWVQIDEPCLGLKSDNAQRAAFGRAYAQLAAASPKLKLLVAVYFSDLRDNLQTALGLPVAALHVDLVRGPGQLDDLLPKLPRTMSLSLGVVDGRNVWKTDMSKALATVEKAVLVLGSDRVLIGPSCSMLHSPVDLDFETRLDEEMKSWLAFAHQKVTEIATLAKAINKGKERVAGALSDNAKVMEGRRTSPRIHNQAVKQRAAAVDETMLQRMSPFAERQKTQREALKLPDFPTTTIGSFPQTGAIRKARAAHRKGEITDDQYQVFLKEEIANAIRFQEQVGLDVLVHGEAERNDMVEYFGEQLDGYISTRNGWVQSYGSRGVKPPIIFGDVSRPKPMTVDWTTYAQSLTSKPVKGMLTGPITMLEWSFVRDDQPRSETAKQLALAIRDEVTDLEAAGTSVIQIDEPALREGLPLRQEDWADYLRWAVDSFRLAASGVSDRTQVHTHMCYAEFNDIIEAIGELDADVISIESSRSDMELLAAFGKYHYPNEIGPGVYDIHSPRVAGPGEMEDLLGKALEVLTPDQLWVNPDCGLKTRRWEEVEPSLEHMVEAAKAMRLKVRA
jgi:5-methyltetrahydropteroyltriglutamate--homocysteine methyltransferase